MRLGETPSEPGAEAEDPVRETCGVYESSEKGAVPVWWPGREAWVLGIEAAAVSWTCKSIGGGLGKLPNWPGRKPWVPGGDAWVPSMRLVVL